MTTAHRWDTRYSLLRSAVRTSDGISIILRRRAHHSSGGTKQDFAPFPLAQPQGATFRSGPAEQVGASAGAAIAQTGDNRVE